MVPRYRPLIVIGYKYNARKVHLLLFKTMQETQILVLPIYISILTNLLMLPFALLLAPLLCQKIYAVNEVDSHNKSRHSDLSLEKWWVTQCGWLRLCTTVDMGMTIANCCKLFRCGVKRDYFENLLVSESSWNDLLKIATTICFHLVEGPQQITYLPLTRSMMKI